MRRARLFIFLLALLPICCIAGCWDNEDVDRRDLAFGLGLDAAAGNRVTATAQIAVTEIPPLAFGSGPEKPFYTVAAIAETSNQAVLNLENKTTKDLFWGQLAIVVVNRALAQRGLAKDCGFLERHPKIPPQAVVVLTEGSAREYLSASLANKRFPSRAIADFLKSPAKADAVFPKRIWQFVKEIELGPTDAYLPVISYNGDEQAFDFTGIAAFHRDRLAGMLSLTESRLAGMLMGKSDATRLTVPVAGMGKITFRRIASRRKIKLLRTGGNAVFQVQIKAEAYASAITSDKTNLNLEEIERIEKTVERTLSQGMLRVIHKLQVMRADIIGFGDVLRVSRPATWKRTNWNEAYPGAEIQAKVMFHVERVGKYR